MTIERDLDRRLAGFFEEASVHVPPGDLLARSLARVERTGQRPGWQTRDRSLGPSRGLAVLRSPVPLWVVLVLIGLLAAALVIAGSTLLYPNRAVTVAPSESPTTERPTETPEATRLEWVVAGSMIEGRDIGATAVKLVDGRVLVAGGHATDDAEEPASIGTELFDPSSQRWTRAGNMTVPRRSGQSLTVLADGRVLAAGGSAYQVPGAGPSPEASVDLFDPTTGGWAATGAMTVARSSHIATLLPDGRVLVVGGFGRNLKPVKGAEAYDPSTGTWTGLPSPTKIANVRAAATLPSGLVLVLGDSIAPDQALAAEAFDPARGTWTPVEMPKEATCLGRLTSLVGGRLLVMCGTIFDLDPLVAAVFDPVLGTWSPAAPPLRRFVRAAALADGQVFLADRASGELFDSATGTWTAAGLPTYIEGQAVFRATVEDDGTFYEYDTATPLDDGRVLLTIGPATVIYDPASVGSGQG